MPLNCTLKMGKMVHFQLCIFYHNKKVVKRIDQLFNYTFFSKYIYEAPTTFRHCATDTKTKM